MPRLKPGRDYIGISVAFWCTDGAGRFLFQKRGEGVRDEPGKWDLGGGQLEFDENLQAGVLRELNEEYGCSGEIIAQLPAHDWIGGEGLSRRHWLIVPFIIKVDPSKIIVRETDKIAEVRWCAFNEAPSPLHSGTCASLELCKSHLEQHLR